VREIVRQLRNHPALVLWCGGNEFSTRANRPVIEVMRRAVMAEDDTRRFQEASPAGGESHNWKVWHEFCPPEDYRRDVAQLMSEFGLQAPPVVASLQRFIPPDELWPPGPSWKYHRAQMAKLRHYARPFQISSRQSPNPDFQLSTFVIAAQRAQARGIQIAVEHARRRKYATSGFLVWQFNSPWPAIDWALVDYYRAPKLAYYELAEIANPLLVSLDYPLRRYLPGEEFTADVWVINDWLRDFPSCRVEVAVGNMQETFKVDIKPDSAEMVGHTTWILPGGDLRVTCRLVQGDRVLSTNRYDLSEYDGRTPSSFFVSWHRTLGTALRL
jgi:beta-mannosidase